MLLLSVCYGRDCRIDHSDRSVLVVEVVIRLIVVLLGVLHDSIGLWMIVWSWLSMLL